MLMHTLYDFGLSFPRESNYAWGARGIVTDRGLDIPRDRTSVYAATQTGQAEFCTAVNAIAAEAFEQANRLIRDREIRGDVAERFRLTPEDSLIRVDANTIASHGYLYFTVYPDQTPVGTVPAALQWSGKDPVPAIGSVVQGREKESGLVLGTKIFFGWTYVLVAVGNTVKAWPGNDIS